MNWWLGKILGIALQRKSSFLCAEVLRFRSLLAGVIASKDSLVSPYKIKPTVVNTSARELWELQ